MPQAPPAGGFGKGGRKGAFGGPIADRITSLCSKSPALSSDFDGRVRQFLADIQEKQGIGKLDDAFDVLHEWLSKKGERSDVQNWPGYIMKLLSNWRSEMEN